LSNINTINYSTLLETYAEDNEEMLNHLYSIIRYTTMVYDQQRDIVFSKDVTAPVQNILTSNSSVFQELVDRVAALEALNNS